MLQQAQKPIAVFSTEAHAVKDKDGVTSYVNRHMVTIQQAGSKDSVEKVAEDWLKDLAAKSVTRGDFDPQANEYRDWYEYFSKRFEAYKQGLEMPLDGTPIKMCLSFTPAERAQCESVRLYTLESLAAANEEVIARLGMGGRTLKTKAAKMLETQAGGKLAEQNAALQQKVDELTAQVQELRTMLGRDPSESNSNVESQMAEMRAMIASLAAKPEEKKRGRPAKVQ